MATPRRTRRPRIGTINAAMNQEGTKGGESITSSVNAAMSQSGPQKKTQSKRINSAMGQGS